MTAVAFRHADVARRLIKEGARVNARSDRGETALMDAARYRNLEMAQLLIDSGADATIRDDLGRTAAVWAPDGTTPDMRALRDLLERAAAPSVK
jgi:ankyrin repeat protein